jgi:hypothetical protein
MDALAITLKFAPGKVSQKFARDVRQSCMAHRLAESIDFCGITRRNRDRLWLPECCAGVPILAEENNGGCSSRASPNFGNTTGGRFGRGDYAACAAAEGWSFDPSGRLRRHFGESGGEYRVRRALHDRIWCCRIGARRRRCRNSNLHGDAGPRALYRRCNQHFPSLPTATPAMADC